MQPVNWRKIWGKINILILLLIMLISCKQENNAQNNKNRGIVKLTQEEKQIREREFNEFKNLLIQKLKDSKDFLSIKNYLDGNFRYRYEEESLIFYKENTDNLNKIHKLIDTSKLIFVLENGIVRNSGEVTFILYEKGYPTLDFRYNAEKHKWEFKAIRYESD